MNKYLITGFSGFVGYYFAEYLANSGENDLIMGLDIQNPNFEFNHYKNLKIHFEKTDLLSRDQVECIVNDFQPDYILHLASYSSVGLSWKDPVESFRNNTNIFLNLMDVVRKLRIPSRILSIGSSEEYGNARDEDLPLRENHKLNPVSPYAVARMAQELLSKVYINGFGMDLVLTRSFNHVGPMQRSIFVISSLAKQLVAIKKSGWTRGDIVTGDISIVRDFTDVRDVVRAYDLLLKKGETGQVYNVCSGRGFSVKDIIEIMVKQLDIEVNIKIDSRLIRPADNKKIIGSNEKIKKELGWQNRIPLEKSISDIIVYWEKSLNAESNFMPIQGESSTL
ncbi:MAG: hypothetical protein APR62_13410 [Smithella sp. SDB]|nr:MAG: hypothetical protein APR62_13410 [Smithella sp. SDB]